VTYVQAYLTVPALGFSVQDLQSGDRYQITNKTPQGFDVAFFNSSGGGVSRTFDFIAQGFWLIFRKTYGKAKQKGL